MKAKNMKGRFINPVPETIVLSDPQPAATASHGAEKAKITPATRGGSCPATSF
jgi:hypothetical protein